MKKRIVFLALVILVATLLAGCIDTTPINAGNGTIQGYVYTDGIILMLSATPTPPPGHIPVNGARVTLSGSTLTATTNGQGYYVLNRVPVGTYTLTVVEEVSGVSLDVEVTVENGKTSTPTGATDPEDLGPLANIEGYVWEMTYSDGVKTWNALAVTGTGSDCSPPSGLPAPNDALVIDQMPVLSDKVTKIYWAGMEKGTVENGHFRVTGLPIQDGEVKYLQFGDGTNTTQWFNVPATEGDNLLNLACWIQAPWQPTSFTIGTGIVHWPEE